MGLGAQMSIGPYGLNRQAPIKTLRYQAPAQPSYQTALKPPKLRVPQYASIGGGAK